LYFLKAALFFVVRGKSSGSSELLFMPDEFLLPDAGTASAMLPGLQIK